MENYIASLEKEFSLMENGFKEEEKRALSDYRSNDKEFVKKLAFLAYNSNTYQIRMYGVFLFGYLSEQNDILTFMRDEVSKDDNWRVQEVLAKAFDEFCKNTGYEKALPIIDEWLENDNPNTRRAVTEGLRIWTSRPYFKDNPNEAIRRIVALKEDPSEYVRKSVGNALRDISKKFPELIKDELNNWKLESKEINQVSFDRVARKYGIDYSLKKEVGADPPKYLVFFKAKDVDVMTAAFREYAGVELKKKQVKKPSVRKKLQKSVERKAKHRQRVKQRQKSRGQER